MADAAPVRNYVAKPVRGFEFRPAKRKPGAGRVTRTIGHGAFARHSFRGGRVSPSEGEASGGGAM